MSQAVDAELGAPEPRFGEALLLLRGEPERRAERAPQQGPQRVPPEAGEIREPDLVGHHFPFGPRGSTVSGRPIAYSIT